MTFELQCWWGKVAQTTNITAIQVLTALHVQKCPFGHVSAQNVKGVQPVRQPDQPDQQCMYHRQCQTITATFFHHLHTIIACSSEGVCTYSGYQLFLLSSVWLVCPNQNKFCQYKILCLISTLKPTKYFWWTLILNETKIASNSKMMSDYFQI